MRKILYTIFFIMILGGELFSQNTAGRTDTLNMSMVVTWSIGNVSGTGNIITPSELPYVTGLKTKEEYSIPSDAKTLTKSRDLMDYEVSIYPNPVRSELKLRLGISSQFTYQIINLHGQVLESGLVENKESEQQLDVRHLSSGIYQLIVKFRDHQSLLRFIKN